MVSTAQHTAVMETVAKVREIMRKHGVQTIYCNKYAASTGVKCYTRDTKTAQAALKAELKTMLETANVDWFDFSETEGITSGLYAGFIVRLPAANVKPRKRAAVRVLQGH